VFECLAFLFAYIIAPHKNIPFGLHINQKPITSKKNPNPNIRQNSRTSYQNQNPYSNPVAKVKQKPQRFQAHFFGFNHNYCNGSNGLAGPLISLIGLVGFSYNRQVLMGQFLRNSSRLVVEMGF
jgi:hypothetical protein